MQMQCSACNRVSHITAHLKKTLCTEASTGIASGLWLQTGADGEILLPIVLKRTGGSKC